MIPAIGTLLTNKVVDLITAPGGINANIAAITQGSGGFALPLDPFQVRAGNIASDLAERSNTVVYPAANVYCEKIANTLVEKFRTFSGTMQMAVEIRQSQDRLDNLQTHLEVYTDAMMQLLNASRGDWGDGMFYAGAYQVSFGPVKHGGRNYIQAAKITFEIGVSIS